MKGAGAGLVLQVAHVTPALREAEGPLSIREAARLLNLSNNQVYNWMRFGYLLFPHPPASATTRCE